MKVAILDKVVRENIALFQHLVQRFLHSRKLRYLSAKKAYRAFINCKTGQLKFADLQEKYQHTNGWKAIIIQLHPIDNEEGVFEVIAEETPNQFPCDELNSEAHVRLARTIHVLNQLSFDPRWGRNLDWILRHIADLTFEFTEIEEGQKNLVDEAWHNVDRMEAERLLLHTSIGTYLFRKDYFAQTLEEELNRDLADPILCITLTYKLSDEKICDKTLVYKNGNWLFYNDDPSLSGKMFPTIKALLSAMKEVLQFPLTSEEMP